MIRSCSGTNGVRAFLLSGVVPALLLYPGCKKQDSNNQALVVELAASALNSMAERAAPQEKRVRAQTALSKLQNAVVDPEPLLISAVIGFPEPNRPVLSVVCFDEDRDIRGLRIKEQYSNPNGMPITLEEDYPVFVNALKPFILECVTYPVQIRDKQQRKDKYLWLEHVNRNLDGLIREYVDKRQHDANGASPIEVTEAMQPSIYVSIPDSNRVYVSIAAYDRAGHESMSIALFATPLSVR